MDLKTTENRKKLDNTHKKMLVVFTGIGIISFTLGAIVNYYTIKKLVKK